MQQETWKARNLMTVDCKIERAGSEQMAAKRKYGMR
jgi:hypothetical protein